MRIMADPESLESILEDALFILFLIGLFVYILGGI